MILVVDFGSQYNQLTVRRVRECKVYCEIHPFHKITRELIKELNPKGIILTGGPFAVVDNDAPRLPNWFLKLEIPILGICYGLQWIVYDLKGKIENANNREYGRAKVDVIKDSDLTCGVWKKGERKQVWMSHGDSVVKLPEGFKVYEKCGEDLVYRYLAGNQSPDHATINHFRKNHLVDLEKLFSQIVLLFG